MKGIVYILRHPVTGDIRYIGKAKSKEYAQAEINQRMLPRKVVEWLNGLAEDFRLPNAETVCECDVFELEEKFAYWFKYLQYHQCNLIL